MLLWQCLGLPPQKIHAIAIQQARNAQALLTSRLRKSPRTNVSACCPVSDERFLIKLFSDVYLHLRFQDVTSRLSVCVCLFLCLSVEQ